jgi:hypothetical protein
MPAAITQKTLHDFYPEKVAKIMAGLNCVIYCGHTIHAHGSVNTKSTFFAIKADPALSRFPPVNEVIRV